MPLHLAPGASCVCVPSSCLLPRCQVQEGVGSPVCCLPSQQLTGPKLRPLAPSARMPGGRLNDERKCPFLSKRPKAFSLFALGSVQLCTGTVPAAARGPSLCAEHPNAPARATPPSLLPPLRRRHPCTGNRERGRPRRCLGDRLGGERLFPFVNRPVH